MLWGKWRKQQETERNSQRGASWFLLPAKNYSADQINVAWIRKRRGAHMIYWANLRERQYVGDQGLFIIHLAVCLTTGPKPLPKRALHIVRSRASSFKWQYPLLSLRSSNSFLRLLPCLLVTSIHPCIFPSITRCRRQFRRKMWPIQFAFRLRISCRIFLCSLTLSNTS